MKKKRVLITGASKGLGLAIASLLIREGYYVIATARSITPSLEQLTQEFPDSISFEPFDMLKTLEIKNFCVDITQKHGRLYGLINNAAIGLDGLLATMHEKDINQLLTVNIEAPILLTKYMCRGMLLNQNGRIINISSIISQTGFNGLSVYAATKASLNGLTKSLARELGKANITVNAILPGYMSTNMTSNIDDFNLQKITRRSPLKKLAETEDVAEMVTLLLSSAGKSITGTEITIDAGSTA